MLLHLHKLLLVYLLVGVLLLLHDLVLQEPDRHLLLWLLLLNLARLLVHLLLLLIELLMLAIGLNLVVALLGELAAYKLRVLKHLLKQRLIVHLLKRHRHRLLLHLRLLHELLRLLIRLVSRCATVLLLVLGYEVAHTVRLLLHLLLHLLLRVAHLLMLRAIHAHRLWLLLEGLELLRLLRLLLDLLGLLRLLLPLGLLRHLLHLLLHLLGLLLHDLLLLLLRRLGGHLHPLLGLLLLIDSLLLVILGRIYTVVRLDDAVRGLLLHHGLLLINRLLTLCSSRLQLAGVLAILASCRLRHRHHLLLLSLLLLLLLFSLFDTPYGVFFFPFLFFVVVRNALFDVLLEIAALINR